MLLCRRFNRARSPDRSAPAGLRSPVPWLLGRDNDRTTPECCIGSDSSRSHKGTSGPGNEARLRLAIQRFPPRSGPGNKGVGSNRSQSWGMGKCWIAGASTRLVACRASLRSACRCPGRIATRTDCQVSPCMDRVEVFVGAPRGRQRRRRGRQQAAAADLGIILGLRVHFSEAAAPPTFGSWIFSHSPFGWPRVFCCCRHTLPSAASA